jgi:hypothetical protein
MKSYSRYLICVASLLVAAVLPASAGSITYQDTANVSGGGISNTNVTATFTLTNGGKTDTISGGVLTFSGVFGSFTVDFSGSCSPTSPCTLSFLTRSGDLGSYTINLNTMTASGTIWNGKWGNGSETGTFSYSLSMPEGGSKLSYLGSAGLVIFGGILLSGFLRPRDGVQDNA